MDTKNMIKFEITTNPNSSAMLEPSARATNMVRFDIGIGKDEPPVRTRKPGGGRKVTTDYAKVARTVNLAQTLAGACQALYGECSKEKQMALSSLCSRLRAQGWSIKTFGRGRPKKNKEGTEGCSAA